MATQDTPDVWGALAQILRSSADVTALASTRIADEVKDDWGFKQKGATLAVVLEGPLGGPGELERPLYRDRYQTRCYGRNKLDAMRMARRVRAAFIPPDGGRIGITYGNCRLTQIEEESGPIRLVEPDTRWESVVQSFVATFIGVPVVS